MNMTRRGFLGAAALSSADLAAASTTHAGVLSPRQAGLLGAWKLLDAVTVHPTGATSAWYDRPGPYSGAIVYCESGAMAVQIASARPAAHGPPPLADMTAARQLEYLHTYYAYFGRFELSEATAEIRHVVECSLDPTEVGRIYVQKFTLQRGRLTLLTQPWRVGREWRHSRLVWARA